MMLTTDAKPDPPRKEIVNTHRLLATNLNQKYMPEISKTNSSVSCPLYSSLTQKKFFSSRKLKFLRIKNEKVTTTSDKNTAIMSKSSNDTNWKANNAVNFNIINSNGIKIGTTTKYVCSLNQFTENFKHTNRDKKYFENSSPKMMPEFVKKLSISKQELSIQDMYTIKTHTGYGWRKVFLSLGYSNGQLDQFMEDYKSKGIGEVIYQILVDWKCANGKTAYVGNIVESLWEHAEYDCVGRLIGVKLNEESFQVSP